MSSRLLRIGVPILVLVVLSGCAQMPTSGPVDEGGEVNAALDESVIRVLPRPPAQGLDPDAVVAGFLAASASFEDDHAVARQFLTADAAETWQPEARVVVIDDRPPLELERSGRSVRLSAAEIAVINPDGALSPRAGEKIVDRFLLAKVGDEWRIDDLPNGLYLNQFDVARTYRSYSLHFLAPKTERLVPDPVFVPIGRTGAATSLVRSLLDGPTRWLAPAVVTAIPPGTRLVVDSVPVENGIAQVDLSAEVLEASPTEREQIAAQLAWTLSELTDVTGVQISVEGSLLELPSAPAVQTAQTWISYDPNALPESASGVLVRKGVVAQLDEQTPEPIVGPLGSRSLQVSDPAISADGSVVAALVSGGTKVVLQERFVSGSLSTVLRGNKFIAPSFDASGSLWLVDRSKGESALYCRLPTGRLLRVRSPELRDRAVVSFRIALDGTRAALVVKDAAGRGELLVARVVAGTGDIRLQALRPLERSLTDVRDVVWIAADRVVALGGDRTSVLEPIAIGIDGQITPFGGTPLQGINGLAGSPGFDLLASTKNSGIWQSAGVGWRFFSGGTAPAYPG